MKPMRLYLMLGLIGTALLGALLAASAQDRGAWPAPPPVLPPLPVDGAPKYQPPIIPKKTQAEPGGIVPAEVFSPPRSNGKPTEIKPDIVQVGGQGPGPIPIPGEPQPPPLLTTPPSGMSVGVPTPQPKKLNLEPHGSGSKLTADPLPLPAPPPLSNGAFPGLQKIDGPLTQQEAPPPSFPPTVTVVDPATSQRIKSFVRIGAQRTDPLPIGRDVVGMDQLRPLGSDSNPLDSQKKTTPPPVIVPPSDGALVHMHTPTVLVEKRGPATLKAGETQTYQIVVRNLGTAVAEQVRIEDELPAGVRLLSADPMPSTQGGRSVWMLSALPAASAQTLNLTLKADTDAQIVASTSVQVAAQTKTMRAASTSGQLSIRIVPPERIRVGRPAEFNIHVANPTGQTLSNIILFAELPAELAMNVRDKTGTMRAERKIEGPVAGVTIAPGDYKVLKMPTMAVKVGQGTIRAKVATNQGEASTSLNVEIPGETLVVQQYISKELAAGQDGELRVEVINNTGKPLKNVAVSNLLPEGIFCVGASEKGMFQSNTRTVQWTLKQLPVDGMKTLSIHVQTSKAGKFLSHVSARADGVAEARTTVKLNVASPSAILTAAKPPAAPVAEATVLTKPPVAIAADVQLKIAKADNVVEVGRETVYEIHVTNPGAAPMNNVQVQAHFPPAIVPKNAQADVKFVVNPQQVTFEPVPALSPQGQLVYRVVAVGQTAGSDQRVRFSVLSGSSPTPITREVSVMVYDANGR